METLMLTGQIYQLILEGCENSDSGTETYTRSGSHYEDGEYERSWAYKGWKGTGKVIKKNTGKRYFFNFRTFTWRDHEVGRNDNDTSFKGTILFIKGEGNERSRFLVANESLFYDLIAEEIIKAIKKQKKREDKGMPGINIQFEKGWLTEKFLLQTGVLVNETKQIHLPFSKVSKAS
jgi:hypothetical protein